MLIWVFVVFAFFSISGSKLPPYMLPLFPPMAIILGYFFHEKWQSPANKTVEIYVYMLLFFIFGTSALLSQTSLLSTYIQDMSGDTPSGIIKDLQAFSLWVSLSSFIMICLLIFKRFTTHAWIFTLLSSFSLAIMFGILFNLNVIDRLRTAKDIAMMINDHKTEADYIIGYSSYEQTIPFYIGKGITVASYTGELEMGSKYEDAKKIFIAEEEFLKLLSSDKKVLFVTKEKRLQRLQEMFPERIRIQGCQNDRCLVANH